MSTTLELIVLLTLYLLAGNAVAAITCANARRTIEATGSRASWASGKEENSHALHVRSDKVVNPDRRFRLLKPAFYQQTTASPTNQLAQNRPAATATLQGLVTDLRTKQPVSGALVRLHRGRAASDLKAEPTATALTDERGQFRLENLEAGVYQLAAAKSGYLPFPSFIVELEAGKPTVRAIELDQLNKFSGRVVDEFNRPVNGAKVIMDFGARQPSAALRRLLSEQGRSMLTTLTNAQGEFELLAPAQEGEAALLALMLGYAPGRLGPLSSETSRGRTGMVLRLPRGLIARGRVLDQNQMPIRDALVVAHNSSMGEIGVELEAMEPRAKSGPEGRFVLRGLEKGIYRLKVSYVGHASNVISEVEILTQTANVLPDIVLQPDEQIRGRIADTDGQPISGAKVSAFSAGVNSGEATSDDKGLFVLTGFAPGARVSLSAKAIGYTEASKIVSAPDEDIILVLPRLGRLRGRVEEVQTLTPIRSFQIRNGVGPMSRTFHSEDGTFEWKEVPPGRWSFVVQAPGYQPAEITDVEIRAGEPTEVIVFPLARGVELTGHVVDAASGIGLPDVSVNYHEAGEVKSAAWLFHSTAIAQRTDADGKFKFDSLKTGKITIIAKGPRHAEARQTVVAGTESFVEIKLHEGSSVSGQVVSSDTVTPAAGAEVSLLNAADMSSVTLPADGNGAFSFGGLAPGRYRLSAENRIGQTNPQDIVLRENERLRNLLLVVKAGATISGRVTGLRPHESPVVEILAEASGDFVATTSTVADGAYAVRGLPSGHVRVTAQTRAQRRISRLVEIQEGTLEIRLDLEFGAPGRLSGRVTRGGEPVAYPTVYPSSRNPVSLTASGNTDANGFYNIDGLSESDYDISTRGATRSIWVSGSTVLDIELPVLSVSGRVMELDSGRPLSGVTIQMQRLGSVSDAAIFANGTTDPLGRFTIEGLDSGQYRLLAEKRGFKVVIETLSVPASSAVLLSLAPAEGIAIRVRDGVSGLGLRGATVEVFSGAPIITLAVALDEDGSGELSQLPAGQYNLRVSSSGYAAKSIFGWKVPAPPLNLFLTPGGRLEVQTDGGYVGAQASLMEANGTHLNPQIQFRLSPLSVLPNLAPGEYTLGVKLPERSKTYTIGISEGKTTVLLVK